MSLRSARSTVSSLVGSITPMPSVRKERRQEALRIQIARKEQKKRDEEARKEAEEQLFPYVAAWHELCDIEEAAHVVKDYLLGCLRPNEEYYEQDIAGIAAEMNEEYEIFPTVVFSPPENIESFGDIRQYVPTQNIGSTVAIADHDLRHTRVGLPSGWKPEESLRGRTFDPSLAEVFPIPRHDVISLDSRRASSTLQTDSRPGSVHASPAINASQLPKTDEFAARMEAMSENNRQVSRPKFAPSVTKLVRSVTTPKAMVGNVPDCYLDEYYNIHPG